MKRLYVPTACFPCAPPKRWLVIVGRVTTSVLARYCGACAPPQCWLVIVGAVKKIPLQNDLTFAGWSGATRYIPLPDEAARKQLITILLRKQPNTLTAHDIDQIVKDSHGYGTFVIMPLVTRS